MSPEVASAKTSYLRRDGWFDECYRNPKARFASAESLIASMDAAGIERAVITGFAFADPALCAASNDYLIEAVRRFPGRFIGLAAVQPLSGVKAVYELERCLQAGLSGAGELLPDGQKFDPADKVRLNNSWQAPYKSMARPSYLYQRTGGSYLPRQRPDLASRYPEFSV